MLLTFHSYWLSIWQIILHSHHALAQALVNNGYPNFLFEKILNSYLPKLDPLEPKAEERLTPPTSPLPVLPPTNSDYLRAHPLTAIAPSRVQTRSMTLSTTAANIENVPTPPYPTTEPEPPSLLSFPIDLLHGWHHP